MILSYLKVSILYNELNPSSSKKMWFSLVATILICFSAAILLLNTDNPAFNVNIELEEMAGVEYRSESIEVTSPFIGQNFDDSVQFIIDVSQYKLLNLSIYDNEESLIYEQLIIKTSFEISKINKPGVYYWRIDNGEEIIYNGKFYYQKD